MAKTNYHGPNTFDGYNDYLSGKARRKLSHNVYVERDGLDVVIVFHWTVIIRYRPDGTFVLDSGGYRSVTTKLNLNQYSDCIIWQKDYVWFVAYNESGCMEFKDGMVFDSFLTQ